MEENGVICGVFSFVALFWAFVFFRFNHRISSSDIILLSHCFSFVAVLNFTVFRLMRLHQSKSPYSKLFARQMHQSQERNSKKRRNWRLNTVERSVRSSFALCVCFFSICCCCLCFFVIVYIELWSLWSHQMRLAWCSMQPDTSIACNNSKVHCSSSCWYDWTFTQNEGERKPTKKNTVTTTITENIKWRRALGRG